MSLALLLELGNSTEVGTGTLGIRGLGHSAVTGAVLVVLFVVV